MGETLLPQGAADRLRPEHPDPMEHPTDALRAAGELIVRQNANKIDHLTQLFLQCNAILREGSLTPGERDVMITSALTLIQRMTAIKTHETILRGYLKDTWGILLPDRPEKDSRKRKKKKTP